MARNHDDIVALCLKQSRRLIDACGGAPKVFSDDKLTVRGPFAETEEPCGKGFIDLSLLWQADKICVDEYKRESRWPVYVEAAIIVEVKSNRERWSAGSVTRQLKRYKFKRATHTKEPVQLFPFRGDDGWKSLAARVRHRMVLVADRDLTESEAALLRHERILVVRASLLEDDWVPSYNEAAADALVEACATASVQ